MTHDQRIAELASIGWTLDVKSGRHLVCGELCAFVSGRIETTDWAAWLGIESGMVYVQTCPAIDLAFEAFLDIVRDGWPVKKTSAARSFDFGD